MSANDDNALDCAIDDVARMMTAGELDGGFRARVRERIDAGPGARRAGVGVLAAAAIVLVGVVIVTRGLAPLKWGPTLSPTAGRTGGPASEKTAPTIVVKGEAPAPVPTPAPSIESPSTVRLKPDTTDGSARRRRATAADTSAIAALAPPPLDVDRLQLSAIDPLDSIELQEMAMPSIAVAPLPPVDPFPREPLSPARGSNDVPLSPQ